MRAGPQSPSVSPTFHPAAELADCGRPADTRLDSADNVRFHVHARVLSRISSNTFGGVLEAPSDRAPILVAEDEAVLDVVLRAVYGLPLASTNSDLATLAAAVSALLDKYGASVDSVLAPTSPLTLAILAHARTQPVDVYALAGAHGLDALASTASEYLLSCDLTTLSGDVAERIGSVWLVRLWALHERRKEALRGHLVSPPAKHPFTPGGSSCSPAIQQSVARSWIIITANLIWKSKCVAPSPSA